MAASRSVSRIVAVTGRSMQSCSTRCFSSAPPLSKDKKKNEKLLQKLKGRRDYDEEIRKRSILPKNPEIFKDVKPTIIPIFNPAQSHTVGDSVLFSNKALKLFKAVIMQPYIIREMENNPHYFSTTRKSTLRLYDLLEKASDKDSAQCRQVLLGDPGSGKTFSLFQGIDYALNKNWIVLFIPDADRLINSSSNYIYDESRQEFIQPQASASILNNLVILYSDFLATLPSAQDGQKTLLDEIKSVLSVNEPSKETFYCLERVLQALSKQSERPVLLAIDNVQRFFAQSSSYLAPDNEPIPVHGLSIPRILLEYIHGLQKFSKGAVLCAPRATDVDGNPASFFVGTGQRSQKSFEDMGDLAYYEIAKSLTRFPLEDLIDRVEAAGIAKAYKDAHLIRHLSDMSFLQTLMQSGGNVRQFTKGWNQSLA